MNTPSRTQVTLGIELKDKAIADLVAKAMRDPLFRDRLLHDPKETVQEYFNVELSEDVEVRVVEDLPTQLTLVLPQLPQYGESQGISLQSFSAAIGAALSSIIECPDRG